VTEIRGRGRKQLLDN